MFRGHWMGMTGFGMRRLFMDVRGVRCKGHLKCNRCVRIVNGIYCRGKRIDQIWS